jgi:hypothetical protein
MFSLFIIFGLFPVLSGVMITSPVCEEWVRRGAQGER